MTPKPILSLTIAALLALALAACDRPRPAPKEEDIPPMPADELVLRNLASEFPAEIRTADLAGRVQLILFFRSDDEPCRAMVPEWNRLQADFGERGLSLIGALPDSRRTEIITGELAALSPNFPVGLASTAVLNAFGGDPAIHALPTAFLMSRDSQVVRSYAGFVPMEWIREDVDHLLNGRELPEHIPEGVAPEDNEA